MRYADILELNPVKVKELHKRCSVMMHSLNKLPKGKLEHFDERSHTQYCYDLYQLSHRIVWYAGETAETFIVHETSFSFESIEELELKLSIRGY